MLTVDQAASYCGSHEIESQLGLRIVVFFLSPSWQVLAQCFKWASTTSTSFTIHNSQSPYLKIYGKSIWETELDERIILKMDLPVRGCNCVEYIQLVQGLVGGGGGL